MAMFVVESKIINTLVVDKSLSLNLQQKIINEEKRALIWQALLKPSIFWSESTKFLTLACHGFWKFINEVIEKLLQDLNATVTSAGEVEVAVLELEEQWSYVWNKKNQQWLWLSFSF